MFFLTKGDHLVVFYDSNFKKKYIAQRKLKNSYLLLLIASLSWGGSFEGVVESSLSINNIIFRALPIFITLFNLLLIDANSRFTSLVGIFNTVFLAGFFYSIFSFIFGIVGYSPLLSSWKSFEYVVVIYWGSVYFHNYTNNTFLHYLKLTYYFILCLSIWLILVGLLNPSDGFYYSGRLALNGLFPTVNPNALGFYSLIGFLIGLYLIKNGNVNRFNLIGILLLLFIFFVENSRTAYFSLVFIFLVYGCESLIKSYSAKSFIYRICFIVALAFISFFINEIFFNIFARGDLESFSRFSGRIHLWESGIEQIKENFPFGLGITTAAKSIYREGVIANTSIHNSYIETIMNAGVFGLLWIGVFILFFIKASFSYIKSKNLGVFDAVSLQIIIILSFRFFTSSAYSSFQLEVIIFLLIFSSFKKQRVLTAA